MTTINLKLIDSLAQVILALSEEEQVLLGQRIQQSKEHLSSSLLDKFFDELSNLPPDPDQLSLEEISEEVRQVRHELWSPS
ncbi:hypothetical protein C7293_14085 [filamentous cyanobacterium CCT1]|nr:hypothetical protein C7293_14085 [filamentous cyanobacterium CCT1]PSN79421.1 hypothetical protein C8B47_11775 [filamentous cyanobacterium CCP4]